MSEAGPLKIIFAGTPDFSVPPLQALIDSPHEVVAVYTQPDRPAGRGRKLSPSPVKHCALQHDIPVYQPQSLKNTIEQDELIALQADLMVVVAYGLILPKAILDAPRLGCINIHASLLPRWRGAAPIQRAILAGDRHTGITIMQMDVGLDTGDMLLKQSCEVLPTDTGSSLHERLSEMGAQALMQALPGIENGSIKPEKQDDAQANYADKLQKSEARIDWTHSAEQILHKVNAFNAWPVAQTPLQLNNAQQAQMLRIWRAQLGSAQAPAQAQPGEVLRCDKQGLQVATGEGVLELLEIQMPGKKPMPVSAFINAHDLTGQILGGGE